MTQIVIVSSEIVISNEILNKITFIFHSATFRSTFHLVHGLSASLLLKFGTPYLFTSGNHNHSPLSDVSKDTLLPVSLSCHLASIHQRTLILFILTLALYKSFTYLLTYLLTYYKYYNTVCSTEKCCSIIAIQ